MYAVFSGRTIAYLGDNRTDALETLDSKDGATLSQVNTLASLSVAFATYRESYAEEDPDEPDDKGDYLVIDQDCTDAMERILQKIEDAGFAENCEEQFNQLRERAVNAVAEVKSLSIKSMAVVGKGFVAIGDLLTALDDLPSVTVDDKEPDEGQAEDESNPVID